MHDLVFKNQDNKEDEQSYKGERSDSPGINLATLTNTQFYEHVGDQLHQQLEQWYQEQ